MNQRAQEQPINIRFVELMRAGHVAYSKGKRSLAHQIWRHAAMLRPYDEQVWLALLNVLDTDEDRQVCLANIVAINPNNLQAHAQLTEYNAQTQPIRVVTPLPERPQHRLWHYVLRTIEGLVLGILLALLVSLIQAATAWPVW